MTNGCCQLADNHIIFSCVVFHGMVMSEFCFSWIFLISLFLSYLKFFLLERCNNINSCRFSTGAVLLSLNRSVSTLIQFAS